MLRSASDDKGEPNFRAANPNYSGDDLADDIGLITDRTPVTNLKRKAAEKDDSDIPAEVIPSDPSIESLSDIIAGIHSFTRIEFCTKRRIQLCAVRKTLRKQLPVLRRFTQMHDMCMQVTMTCGGSPPGRVWEGTSHPGSLRELQPHTIKTLPPTIQSNMQPNTIYR